MGDSYPQEYLPIEDPECVGWHTWIDNGWNELFYARPDAPADGWLYYIEDSEFELVGHSSTLIGASGPVKLSHLFTDPEHPTSEEKLLFELEFGVEYPVFDHRLGWRYDVMNGILGGG